MNREQQITLLHDGLIKISVGRSRKETRWQSKELKWSELIEKLSKTVYTEESFEEYKQLPKAEQDDIKDVGGFVGGTLIGGKRGRDTIDKRNLITLDADFAKPGLWDTISMLFDFSCCIYSTHKHSPEKPRLRIVIPLQRPVSPDEYQAISRRVASDIGMNYFDDTTHEPSRLMYWPSTSRDGIYQFNYMDGEWLNPDGVLARYSDWKDTRQWPESSKVREVRAKQSKRHGNPKEKGGVLGAFCRTYSVRAAINKFLSDVYIPCADRDRYTYTKGSTTGGLVIYEDGDFAYSYHGTDPAVGRLLNSFDLVRIHSFGELDHEAKEGTPIHKLPSFQKMLSFCLEDDGVRVALGQETIKSGKESYAKQDDTGSDWLKLMDVDKRGSYKPTIANVVLILQNDPDLKGRIALNEFSHRTMIRKSLPWHTLENEVEGDSWKDSDDAALRHYIEETYGITCPGKINDAVLIVEEKNKYHPIVEYLESLVWDGVRRVESLFIDYLGADDGPYTRAVTKKALVAAVARVFVPGIKFDYMLVLVGKQGIGKSYIINRLGRSWYSDSLNTVQGKEAYEQLQDAWLIEMAELSAAKKAETESVKHFISKQEDIYRVAYGKRVNKFKRQCVFFGTTNDIEFLRDKTGNRRFWPVVTGKGRASKNLWKDMTESEIDQIWAEAVAIWKAGEELFLRNDIEEEAERRQELHTEESLNVGLIREYLNMLLPEDWRKMKIWERRNFIHKRGDKNRVGTVKREKVCAMEIWVEVLEGELKEIGNGKSREINDILRKMEGWQPYPNGDGKVSFGNPYGNQRGFVRKEVQQ